MVKTTNLESDSVSAHLIPLMHASKQGFALFDESDTLRFANSVFRERLGLAEDTFPTWVELMRKGYQDNTGTKIETRDFDKWLASAKSRRGKLPYRTIETEILNGPWVLTTETTLPDGWMLCVVTDVTELAQDWRDLRQERDLALKSALTDELTGLGNRRYVMAQLHRMLGPDKATCLAAIMLDIDYFKRINDTYGHDAGDVVLKHFASQLLLGIRRDDIVGRIGGEEFLILMPGATPDNVHAVLGCIFHTVRQASPLTDVPDFRFACSAGVAIAIPGEAADSVLRRADELLYEAKGSGRDRYIVSDGDW